MKKLKIITIAIALALSCLGTASASPMSLDECVSHALAKNPELAAAQANVASSEAQSALTAVARRFKLDGFAAIDYTNGVNTSSLTQQVNNEQVASRFGITAQQLLFDLGKSRLQLSAAEKAALAAKEHYDEMKNQIIARVSDAYYNLNKATRQKAVAETRYNNYQDRLDLANNFFRVGSKPKIEVTKAEADLAKAKLGLVASKTGEKKCQIALAAAIGDPTLDVTASQDALESPSEKIDTATALDHAMKNRQEIKSQELKLASAAANLEYKKRGHAPELYLTGGLDRSGEVYSEKSFYTEGTDGWRVGASLNVPLLDGGKTRAEVRLAKAQLEAEKATLEKLKNDVAQEVLTACASLEEAEESVTAAREQERFATETHTIARIRYQAGAGDNLEISDAIEGLSEAQNNVINSLYNCKSASITLKKAMGDYK